MNDTSALLNTTYRQLFVHLTGEERLQLASESFESAKVIVRASFSGMENEIELRKKWFLRFYGNDLSEVFVQKFLKYLSTSSEA
jgi:hypothetical protein